MPYDSKGRCIVMTPEARAREQIDNRLRQSGWTIQDLKQLNLTVASGVAVREFPTNTGPVDYALFIEGVPVGVVACIVLTGGAAIPIVADVAVAVIFMLLVIGKNEDCVGSMGGTLSAGFPLW